MQLQPFRIANPYAFHPSNTYQGAWTLIGEGAVARDTVALELAAEEHHFAERRIAHCNPASMDSSQCSARRTFNLSNPS
jgi:hypothetical protein